MPVAMKISESLSYLQSENVSQYDKMSIRGYALCPSGLMIVRLVKFPDTASNDCILYSRALTKCLEPKVGLCFCKDNRQKQELMDYFS